MLKRGKKLFVKESKTWLVLTETSMRNLLLARDSVQNGSEEYAVWSKKQLLKLKNRYNKNLTTVNSL